MDVAESAAWLGRSDGTLTRRDTNTGAIQTFSLAGPVTSIAAGPAAVWAADELGRVVRRVDSESGKVRATIPVGGRPAGLAIASDSSVWVTIQGQ